MSVVLYSAHRSFPKEITGIQQWAGALVLLVRCQRIFSCAAAYWANVLPVAMREFAIDMGLGFMMIGTQRFYGQRPSWWLFHLIWLVCMAWRRLLADCRA
jgi:hypothetical protein